MTCGPKSESGQPARDLFRPTLQIPWSQGRLVSGEGYWRVMTYGRPRQVIYLWYLSGLNGVEAPAGHRHHARLQDLQTVEEPGKPRRGAVEARGSHRCRSSAESSRPSRRHPEGRDRVIAQEPIGRMGRPDEIAATVVWLCSDAASFVTGHALVADGGQTL
jgi:hypothetical protein